ncbi:PQQ-binding-like beta-propeller repeat protein [Lentisphaera profundi]|uniref:PQQ-binding-like beta-propeller repeat protein n=1 Tax=Lentisphaera profundi TaxID=1658616 RepID=A0ABY7VMN2_9BACT|nr:PQQ-binding-like beta-propeller repeat protein [Lentisphaera profundi]WDE95283.1 PQQ-binding-like beta-propeller repeat protein [Lentisphaera profundi]
MKAYQYTVMIILCLFSTQVMATPTENYGFNALPADGNIKIDGKSDDWDLSQSIFICNDVHLYAETYAMRFAAQYDNKYLYLLGYWYDKTPLNNPGQVSADHGWLGDSLQVRIMTGERKTAKVTHVTAWRGVGGGDIVTFQYGDMAVKGKKVVIKNAKLNGVLQAFGVRKDGSGYVQELTIPWELITKDKKALVKGDRLKLAAEANFTLDNGTRLTIKGNWNPDGPIDRIFTYRSLAPWGYATLADKAAAKPLDVRLGDGRTFPTIMNGKEPSIDWTGLKEEVKSDGFKNVTVNAPADGYVSTVIKDKDGKIVRHLANNQKVKKGENVLSWDVLSTPNFETLGMPIKPGTYSVHSLWHPEYEIMWRGWAGSSAQTPWENGPKTNWGGDHGSPTAIATGDKGVFLGWFKSESGRALVATDFDGKVMWRKKFGGMSSVKGLATAGDIVFVLGGPSRGKSANGAAVYKMDQSTGLYKEWAGSPAAELAIDKLSDDPQLQEATAIAAFADRFYLSFSQANKVRAYDSKSGKQLAEYDVPKPAQISCDPQGNLYVLSGGDYTLDPNGYNGIHEPAIVESQSIYKLDTTTKKATKLTFAGLKNACGIYVDKTGDVYVGIREPVNQVYVYNAKGNILKKIGQQGGRPLTGPWNQNGMRFVSGVAIDKNNQLWVCEADNHPLRFSRWDVKTGAFSKEFFGPTNYGARGAAINPEDPNKMMGISAEWELDPKTQTFKCLGVITRKPTANSVALKASNGRVYFISTTEWRSGDIDIFERLGDGDFVKRASFTYEGKRLFGQKKKIDASVPQKTHYWADQNGDGKEQANEVTTVDCILHFNPWNLHVWNDFTFYSAEKAFPLKGFTKCNAPIFDIKNPEIMPVAGVGSLNSDVMLSYSRKDWGKYNSWYTAYDRKTGEELWKYPNTFVGVQGSHKGPAFPQTGLIRGSYGPLTSIKLPAPIGNAWIFTTNVGEWHVLTEEGFYLTNLFNGDYLNWKWPAKPEYGANMNGAPSGGGGEDFGGYVQVTEDGKVYAQSGHTAFWNLELKGFDKTERLAVTSVKVTTEDFQKAADLTIKMAKAKYEPSIYKIMKYTPGAYYANLNADFKGQEQIKFNKTKHTHVKVAASYDDKNLYVGWQVKDKTPWVNGAEEAQYMYGRGDTVDLQIQAADYKGKKAYQRLSIGNLKGKDTAVLYREKSAEKKPMSFSSGVITDFPVDYVAVEGSVKVQSTVRGENYWVQASIPWSVLGIQLKKGDKLKVDFGVTYGDAKGTDTVLRNHWSNKSTGLVNDEVFELKLDPKNWGELNVQ